MKTLVLNTDMTPFDIWSWQRAMTNLLCTHTVMPIVFYTKVIRDGRGNEYDVPAVVSLKSYQQNQNKRAPYSRMNVYARDKGICQYCGVFVEPGMRTIDHVIPRAKWNPRTGVDLNSFENIVTSCKPCNTRKGDRTPSQAGMKLIKQPRGLTRAQAYTNKIMLMSHLPKEWKDYVNV